jgi:multidrug efflux pump subunit AcrA (membrane-fusion protein)
MSTRTSASAVPPDARWEQIEQLLDDVAELSRSNIPVEMFAREALVRVRQSLAASAAGFWEVNAEGQIAPTAEIPNTAVDSKLPLPDHSSRMQVVEDVLRTKTAIVVEVPVALSGTLVAARETGGQGCCALLTSPVRIGDHCAGVLELVYGEVPNMTDRQLLADVLNSVGELFSDYFRRRRLDWLTERELLLRNLRNFSLQIHRSLDVQETAYAIVNEGRLLIGCDRLTLLSSDGAGRCSVLAVSGAAVCDPRSDAVRRLEELARVTSVLRLTIVFPEFEGQSDKLPPEVRRPLLDFLDASGAKSLAAVTLFPAMPEAMVQATDSLAPVGMLVCEQFSQEIDPAMREMCQLIAEHCAPAVSNAQTFRQAPWMALFGEARWKRWTRGRSRLKLILSAIATVFVLSWIIPARFEIEASGEVQPRLRRDVFVPEDAVVDELKVDHDDVVEAGQVLAILRNPQLDLEYKRVAGELQATRERLGAVQAARVERSVDTAGRPSDGARLSGEVASLQAQLTSLQRQTSLLDEQQAALTVRSPIAGRVLTWDLPQLLQSRPVQRGQVLLRVADPEGPWLLELHVREKRIGHLLKTRASNPQGMQVTYVLATDPARKQYAEIESIGASVESIAGQEPGVLVTAGIDRANLGNPRPGAGATGRVSCGWRPLAYVLLHDLIDAAWAWIQF